MRTTLEPGTRTAVDVNWDSPADKCAHNQGASMLLPHVHSASRATCSTCGTVWPYGPARTAELLLEL